MKRGRKKEALAIYMDECQNNRSNSKYYARYVHGYLIPWFQEQRDIGNLITGKTLIIFLSDLSFVGKVQFTDKNGDVWDYEGEIDKSGKVCGRGVGYTKKYASMRYESTWFDNMLHGICQLKITRS